MLNGRSLAVGIGGVAAGLAMIAFAFTAGVGTTHGQTPGTTSTAAATTPTTSASTPAVTSTVSGAGLTPKAGSPTAAPTGAVSGSQSLPSTGTGSTSGGSDTGMLWLVIAGGALALTGAGFAVSGIRRR